MTIPQSAASERSVARTSRLPAESLAMGVAGGALLAARDRVPRATRGIATIAGVTLLGLAAYPALAALIRRAGGRRRAAEIRMSFVIGQPVERVFAFCRDFENYPRFIGALRSVEDYGDGRSRWCASTPSGGTIEWNTITTKYVPNSVIAWQTVAGSPVHATGVLRFTPENGRTCLQVSISYELLGDSEMRDALAALVTPPRRAQLEADLRKFASYLETVPDAELAAYGV